MSSVHVQSRRINRLHCNLLLLSARKLRIARVSHEPAHRCEAHWPSEELRCALRQARKVVWHWVLKVRIQALRQLVHEVHHSRYCASPRVYGSSKTALTESSDLLDTLGIMSVLRVAHRNVFLDLQADMSISW